MPVSRPRRWTVPPVRRGSRWAALLALVVLSHSGARADPEPAAPEAYLFVEDTVLLTGESVAVSVYVPLAGEPIKPRPGVYQVDRPWLPSAFLERTGAPRDAAYAVIETRFTPESTDIDTIGPFDIAVGDEVFTTDTVKVRVIQGFAAGQSGLRVAASSGDGRVGDEVTLYVWRRYEGPIADAPAELQSAPGSALQRRGRSSSSSQSDPVNVRQEMHCEYRVRLTEPGELTIGPDSFTGLAGYESFDPVEIQVTE